MTVGKEIDKLFANQTPDYQSSDFKSGCGCAVVIVAVAIFFSFPTILKLIEKLIDKL